LVNKIKQIIKARILKRLNIPYNKYGIPHSLYKYIDKKEISLVDVGAHNGDFTKMIAGYCGISKGILIEALPEKAAYLRKHFMPPEYSVIECALSSEEGFIEFEINEAKATSSMLRIKRAMPELSHVNLGSRATIQCRTRTLDAVTRDAKLDSIDLLKLDVQGAEHLVLGGASNIIKKTALVWTEVSFKPLYEMSSDFNLIYKQFNNKGFKLMELEPAFRAPDGELLQGDALFVNKEMIK